MKRVPKVGYRLVPKMMDFDRHIRELPNPKILNRTAMGGPVTAKELLILDKNDDDTVISCDCGELSGNYYEGIRCSSCNTVAELTSKGSLDVVLEIPYGYRILHPAAWKRLSSCGKIKKHIETILNVDVINPSEIVKHGIDGKGFKYLEDNFFQILGILINNVLESSRKESAKKVYDYLYANKDIIFIDKIPLSSRLHTAEHLKGQMIVDKLTHMILEPVNSIITYIKKNKFSAMQFERLLLSVSTQYYTYLKHVTKERFGAKNGIARSNMFGKSLFFTGRTVIAPITQPHAPNEIHIPYSMATSIFRFHIYNGLRNQYNMSLYDAIDYLASHMVKQDKIIMSVLNKLIDDSDDGGIATIIGRNPSMKIGAQVLVNITKILEDDVIKISNLIITEMNADYDGDNDNITILAESHPDNVKHFKSLRPANQIIQYDSLSVKTGIPAGPMMTLYQWAQDE